MHSSIGNVADYDLVGPKAIVSPDDIEFVQIVEQAQTLFDHIPVGVGSQGVIPTIKERLDAALELGADYYGYSGSRAMRLFKPQVVIMVHSGSRGYGHQVAIDTLIEMDEVLSEGKQNEALALKSGEKGLAKLNDRQLACASVNFPEGVQKMKGMICAANFVWVNRQHMTFVVRQAFVKIFKEDGDDLGISLFYDTSHSICKEEDQIIDGKPYQLLNLDNAQI
ncbi:MAG: putative tRNA-splicing ligase [Streblomastix strix]|uniref:3'-phosphate/5'-hydroxy nucleic acid ligase n=1 Tax=Streblomastix strix TaxID=222440 RepID=A0A5J4W2E8_9EUKA|nr:MAG: putative tRNA-splicing ligase [Streblomastix strix]